MSIFEDSISIVVPVYRAGNSFETLVEKTIAVCQKFSAYQIILVDDASDDNSFERMAAFAHANKNIVAIKLKRNVGQQMAIFAGLKHAQCNYTVIIDDDLQQKPQDILKLYKKIKQDYDVVYGINKNMSVSSKYRKCGTVLREKTINRLSGKDSNIKVCSFRIMTKQITKAVLTANTRYVYITMEVLKNTSNVANVAVKYQPRNITRYNVFKFALVLINLYIYYGKGFLSVLKKHGANIAVQKCINGEIK